MLTNAGSFSPVKLIIYFLWARSNARGSCLAIMRSMRFTSNDDDLNLFYCGLCMLLYKSYFRWYYICRIKFTLFLLNYSQFFLCLIHWLILLLMLMDYSYSSFLSSDKGVGFMLRLISFFAFAFVIVLCVLIVWIVHFLYLKLNN